MAIVASQYDHELIAAVRELAEYLQEDPMATSFNVGNSFYWAAEKWWKTKPNKPAEIIEYYRSTDALLHQLVFANYGIPHELDLIARVKDLFGKFDSVLDLGAGIGSFLLSARCGPKTHADVGGKLFHYAAWRYQRAHEQVRMVELPSDYLNRDPFEGEQFDGVICTEVIEHVPDPVALVAFLSKLVKPGGQLLATVSFEDADGMIPQHLNIGEWTNETFISTVFPRHGFERRDEDLYVRLDNLSAKS